MLGGALRFWRIGIGLSELHIYLNDEIFEVYRALQLIRGDYDFLRYSKGLYFYFLAPIYLVLGLFQVLASRFESLESFVSYSILFPGRVLLISRLVTAAVGTASIYLIYKLGLRVLPRRVWRPELILALAWATCPLAAWQARWGLIETTLVFFGLLAILAILGIAERGDQKDYLWASVGVALSAAAKIYGATLVIPYFAAHLIRWRWRSLSIAPRPGPLVKLLVGVGAMAVVYVLVNPAIVVTKLAEFGSPLPDIYGLGSPKNFLQLPIGFYFTTIRWNLGTWSLPFLLIGLVESIRRRRVGTFLCALFGLTFFFLLGLKREAFHIYQRYTLLSIPFLFAVVVYGVIAVADYVGTWRIRLAKPLSTIGIPLLVSLLILWNGLESLAQRPIYSQRYEVVEEVATRWFLENMSPTGRVVIGGKLPWPGHQTMPLFDKAEDYHRRYEERRQRMEAKRGEFAVSLHHSRIDPLRDLSSDEFEVPRFDLMVIQQRDAAESLDAYLESGVEVFIIDPQSFWTFFEGTATAEPGTRLRAMAKDTETRRKLYEELQTSERVKLVKRFEGHVTPGGWKVIEIYEAVD